jgi:hypothetical protein
MINVREHRFLDMVMLLRKQLVIIYCYYPKIRERNGKGSKWPVIRLWRP